MTRAVFKKHGTDYVSFTVAGHTGHSHSGTDIVCSAVSAMTQLVLNTITDNFGAQLEVRIDPRDAAVTAIIKSVGDDATAFAVRGLIDGFREQLLELAQEYPGHVSVTDTAQ